MSSQGIFAKMLLFVILLLLPIFGTPHQTLIPSFPLSFPSTRYTRSLSYSLLLIVSEYHLYISWAGPPKKSRKKAPAKSSAIHGGGNHSPVAKAATAPGCRPGKHLKLLRDMQMLITSSCVLRQTRVH
jgi:hypothetical protein